MNTIEIKCEACDARMRLSSSLLRRIKGRAGRITCKQCSNKVSLDASDGLVFVTSGGVLLENAQPHVFASPHDDPHLSELPVSGESDSRISVAEGRSSVPPPLPIEARASRRMSMEAPLPPRVRSVEDSLSPHTFDGSIEEGVSLAELAHDIRSTPYSAPPPRDQTYSSLYPETPRKSVQVSAAFVHGSRAPTPPRAGELHRSMAPNQNPFESGYGIDVPQGPQAVVVTADGQLLNQADLRQMRGSSGASPGSEKGSRAPWILAAAALFALGLSLSAQIQDGAVWAWRSATHQEPGGAKEAPALIRSATVPEVLIAAEAPSANASDEQRFQNNFERELSQPLLGTIPATALSREKNSASSHVEARVPSGAPQAVPGTNSKTSAAASEVSDSAVNQEEGQPDAGPFSSGAAAASMREATAMASSCRTSTDPSGTARVVVTFAPSGRVTNAVISGPPFAGTTTGGCIASRFRSARVPAFSGEAVTVTKTVTIH